VKPWIGASLRLRKPLADERAYYHCAVLDGPTQAVLAIESGHGGQLSSMKEVLWAGDLDALLSCKWPSMDAVKIRNSTSIAIRALAEEAARTGEPAAADTKRCAERIHAALSAVADSKYEATGASVLGLTTNEGALLLQLTAEEKGRVVQRIKNRSNTSPLPAVAAKCLAISQLTTRWSSSMLVMTPSRS
jgi:hypothetical protein